MTALLAGIDWSSKALHAALIPLDADHGDPTCQPVVFRAEALPPYAGNAVPRIRSVRPAIRNLLRARPNQLDYVAFVAVEEAYGQYRNADRVLLPLQGAILGAIPAGAEADLFTADVWRRELGLRTGNAKTAEAKAQAQTYALDWLSDHTPPDETGTKAFRVPDEHQVDALCVALAARQILNREAAA